MVKKLVAVCISLLMVILLSAASFASDLKLGGNFTLKFTGLPLNDQSTVNWWEFQAYTYKNFGDNVAFLKAKATPSNIFGISAYGYTYKVNNRLSLTAANDVDGEMLADSRVMSDAYSWKDPLHQLNLNNRMFVRQTYLKATGDFANGLKGTVAVAPGQFLVKGQYSNNGVKIGGGFTNTRNGYKDGDASKRALYDVYAEVTPVNNLTLYGEYLEGKRYFVQGDYRLEPFTATVKWGNIGQVNPGEVGFIPETIDGSLEYAFSVLGSVKGGVAYYLTNHPGYARAYGGLTFGPAAVDVNYDFYVKETIIGGSYTIDGSSNLFADYNVQKHQWNLGLKVDMW